MVVPKKIFVELADTPVKRELGLMKRKKMSQDNGMLFKFPSTERLSFWMRDTYIPLDIAFLNDNGKILQIEEMIPLSTRPIFSHNRCRYALEVNRNWFRNNNIQIGNYVKGRGLGKANTFKKAQMGGELQPQQNPPQPDPNVLLDKTHKEKLEDAELRGKDLIIIYRTKESNRELPPKVISPPFTFEDDAEGNKDAVVKAWDRQTAGWKSFIIDNIMNLEEKI